MKKKRTHSNKPKQKPHGPKTYQKPLLRRVNFPIPKVGFARPNYEIVGDGGGI